MKKINRDDFPLTWRLVTEEFYDFEGHPIEPQPSVGWSISVPCKIVDGMIEIPALTIPTLTETPK